MITKKMMFFDYVKIVLSAILLAFCYILFIVPNRFAPAGLNGAATMLQFKLGFSIGYFSLIVNIPLCVLAFFLVDRTFAVKTLTFSLVYSIVYLLLQQFDFSTVSYDAKGVDTIYPCLIAGMISGLVYGICFRANGSTGGTDIVAKYVSKKNQLLNFFWVTFAINACVAAASLFVYAESLQGGGLKLDYKPVCLCLIYCFTSSFIGNTILKGYKKAYKFLVITKDAPKLSEEILVKLKHSATRIEGKGIYSGADKEVLLCVVNKHQIVEFKNILRKYDGTFAMIETVDETFGNFKKIK